MTHHAQRPLYVRVSPSQEVFGILPSTIHRAARRGEIAIHKRGSASFLLVDEIERWIDGRDSEAAA
jgi:hypothetical protein